MNKKVIKNLIPAAILSLVIAFMIYIYEPIFIYSSNMYDFWFDFDIMIGPIILYALILFLVLFAFLVIIYKINKKVYKYSLNIIYIAFLTLYIHGNFFASNLHILDGATVNWSEYKIENIISILIIIAICIVNILLIKKIKIEKTLKIFNYLTILIFLMLVVALISIFFQNDVLKDKIISMPTRKNINNASSDKNFYIILADAVESVEFEKAVETSTEFKSTFDNFTYYPDTVSAYTFTRDSIPFILTGKWNYNEKDFQDYCNEAYENSVLFKSLIEKKYQINIYDDELNWSSYDAEIIDNCSFECEINKFNFAKKLTKYVAYKYLPYPLKKYIDMSNFNFSQYNADEKYQNYTWSNTDEFETVTQEKINIVEEKYFQFMHLEGAHLPYNLNENLERIGDNEGTYEQKIVATLKVINAFINRLKENNVYDNSVIIIMADHGTANAGRHNPILYIKGINEHHEMKISDIPISYEDLNEAYIQLIDDKTGEEVFENININKTRKFIDNIWKQEYSMIEYEVKGKAWSDDAVYPTGVKYEIETNN